MVPTASVFTDSPVVAVVVMVVGGFGSEVTRIAAADPTIARMVVNFMFDDNNNN